MAIGAGAPTPGQKRTPGLQLGRTLARVVTAVRKGHRHATSKASGSMHMIITSPGTTIGKKNLRGQVQIGDQMAVTSSGTILIPVVRDYRRRNEWMR